MAVVPPCTHLHAKERRESRSDSSTEKVLLGEIFSGDLREKSVQHSLSGQQRVIGGQLLRDWSHLSDGPHLNHCELLLHPLKLQLHHHILKRKHTASTQSDV